MRDGKLKKLIIKILAPFRRMGLKNKNCTIISNNCWGGVLNRNFGLKYNSPTCGTFFFAKEYIKFCTDLPAHLNAELKPLEVEDSAYREELMKRYNGKVVLGKLLDAEIVLLHYPSFEEAKKKWDRRAVRVNYDNMIVKFNDQNMFEQSDFYAFDKLDLPNKIFFTANPQLKSEGGCTVCFFGKYAKDGYVKDDIKNYKKYFKVKKFLNSIKY